MLKLFVILVSLFTFSNVTFAADAATEVNATTDTAKPADTKEMKAGDVSDSDEAQDAEKKDKEAK